MNLPRYSFKRKKNTDRRNQKHIYNEAHPNYITQALSFQKKKIKIKTKSYRKIREREKSSK